MTTSHVNPIAQLMGEYSKEDVAYGKYLCARCVDDAFTNNGFMGSSMRLSLTAGNAITHKAPACLAAPRIQMMAQNIINLGEPEMQTTPTRIYAPLKLTLEAKHVVIGNIRLVVEPKNGAIVCDKLTLSKSKNSEEDPDHFEIVKSWIIEEYTTEVEIVCSEAKTEPLSTERVL